MYFYNFIISVDGSDPVILRRSLLAIRTLAGELMKECGYVNEVGLFAELVLGDSSNRSTPTPSDTTHAATEAEASTVGASASCPSAEAVESALRACLPGTNVIRSAAMGKFLHEDVGYGDGIESTCLHHAIPNTTITATDFLLNPLETSELYIPARRFKSLDFMLEKGDSLHWRFAVAYGHGVEFMALFRAINEPTISAANSNSSISIGAGANDVGTIDQSVALSAEAESILLLDQYMLQGQRGALQAKPSARPASVDAPSPSPAADGESASSSVPSALANTPSVPTEATSNAPAPQCSDSAPPVHIESSPNNSSDADNSIIVVRPKRKVYSGEKIKPIVNPSTSSGDSNATNTSSSSFSASSGSVAFTPFYQDCFIAPCKGMCRLLWDNSQSLIYGKCIKYVVNIASEGMRVAATVAAEDETAKSRRKGSSIYRRIFDSQRGDLSVSVDGPWDDPKSADFRQLQILGHGSSSNSSHSSNMVQEHEESHDYVARAVAIEAPAIAAVSSGPSSPSTGVSVTVRVGEGGIVEIDVTPRSPSAFNSNASSTSNASNQSDTKPVAAVALSTSSTTTTATSTLSTTAATANGNGADEAAVACTSMWDTTHVPTGATWKENAYDIATSIGSLALDNKYGQMASTFAEKYVVANMKGLSANSQSSSGAADGDKLPDNNIPSIVGEIPSTASDVPESTSDGTNGGLNEESTPSEPTSDADSMNKQGYYSYYIQTPVLAASSLLTGLLAKTTPLLVGSKDASERSLASIDMGGSHGATSPLTTTMHAGPGGAHTSTSTTPTTAAQFADILRLAQSIEALEDRCARLHAERDQGRAEGIRDRRAMDMLRSDLMAVEATLKTQEEYTASWRDRALQSEAQLDLLKRVHETSLSALSSENESLQQRITEESRARRAAEGRLEQVVLDQNVWGATRDSIHAQLSDSHRRAEEAVKAREIAEAKLRDATQDRESLLERILTLEQQLGYLQKCIEDPSAIDALNEDISTSAGSPRASDTASNKSQVNKAVQIVSLAKYTDLQARYDNIASQLRDTRRRLTEAQGDLEVLRYQAQIDESKIREISRQSVSAASLYKAELAESQMLCELYRDKLHEIKAQKRILVQELRSLRDMGVYKVPLTVSNNVANSSSSGISSDSNVGADGGNTERNGSTAAFAEQAVAAATTTTTPPSTSTSDANPTATSASPMTITTTAASTAAADPVSSTVLANLRELRAKFDTVSAALASNPADKSLSAIASDLKADIRVLETEAKRIFAQNHDDDHSSHGIASGGNSNAVSSATGNSANSTSNSVTTDPSHHLWLSKLLSRERS